MLMLLLAVGFASPAAAQMQALGGAANCRVVVPEGWSASRVRWTGGCHAGRADGRGVLREFEHGAVKRFFFGRLKAGEITFGAIERPDGYVAGRFRAGRVLADDDRNMLIKAFDEASAAAREVAAAYERAGNSASASYYRHKAGQLAQQIN